MTGGTPDLLQPPLPLQLVWLGLLAVATLDWLRRGWRDGQRKERRLALGLLVALAAVGLAQQHFAAIHPQIAGIAQV